MTFIKLGLLLVGCAVASAQLFPQVNIPGLGVVEGFSGQSTINDRRFSAFRGIPFAKPPIGELRFKAPEPPVPWKGVLNTKVYGPVCHQSGAPGRARSGGPVEFWTKFHGQFGDNLTASSSQFEVRALHPEDCLFINVFTPTKDPDAKLPVMVYYHGGSFSLGGSYIYFPDHFMDYDVVLAVPHYRLGPLGFMSLQNDAIPGNAGMLDQVAALEWVRDHIAAFGGDPTQVTAFGESAGGASVSLLALSPLTKGLFKRVIAQSGAALAEWAVDREPRFNGLGVAERAGCDMSSEQTIVDCCMTIDPGYLNDGHDQWSGEQRKLGKSGFGGATPVVQTSGSKVFLDRHPEDIWADPTFEGVPAMYGANKHEGTYVLSIVYDDYIRANGLLDDEEFMKYNIVKPFLEMFGITDGAYTVADAVEYEYIGIERMGNFTAMSPGLIDFGGATFLKAPGYQSVIKHSKFGPSYWYIFNMAGLLTIPVCAGVIGTDYPFPPGVCHGADIPMLFAIPGVYAAMSSAEQKVSRQMVKMWYNFAKYGDPTPAEHPVEDVPTWLPYDPEGTKYLRINRLMEVVSDFPREYTIAREEDFGLK